MNHPFNRPIVMLTSALLYCECRKKNGVINMRGDKENSWKGTERQTLFMTYNNCLLILDSLYIFSDKFVCKSPVHATSCEYNRFELVNNINTI